MNKLQSVNDANNNTTTATTRRSQNSRTGYVYPPLPMLPRIPGLKAGPLHQNSIRPVDVVAIIEHALDVISEAESDVGEDDNDDCYFSQR